jgi:hypothetical protein
MIYFKYHFIVIFLLIRTDMDANEVSNITLGSHVEF